MRRLCKFHTNLENRKSTQIVRLEVLIHYGGNPPKCDCCGENKLEFLSIDHIDGSGYKHRKEDSSAVKLARWLKKNNFPKGFRILCMNCNFAHGIYGYCPHISPSELIATLPENFDLHKDRLWGAKITENDVREIRKLSCEGMSSSMLAEKFGISIGSINNILAGRRWKRVYD